MPTTALTSVVDAGDGMDKSTLDLLLNWGPIIGVLFFPVQTYILEQPDGLRRALRLGIALGFIGNLVRCIPIVVAETGVAPSFVTSTTAYALYHTGQIAIAASGPLFMGTCTRLACVWFGEGERTTATAIAQTANGLGTTVGFLNPQWLTKEPSGVPNIFWFSLVLSVVPVLCALVYLPSGPPSPPSAAAADSMDKTTKSEDHPQSQPQPQPRRQQGGGGEEEEGWWDKIKTAGSNRSFVMLIVGCSVLNGVQAGWQGLLNSILPPGEGVDASWVGFGNGLAENIAAVASGAVIDTFFRRQFKIGILVGLGGCLIVMIWFTLQLPCFLYHDSPLQKSESSLVISLTLAGAFMGVTTPLFYELSAELVYPIKEGMSAGILVLLLNASAAVMIGLNSILKAGFMNFFMTATVALMLVCVLFVKEDFQRPQDSDETAEGGHGEEALLRPGITKGPSPPV